MNNVHFSQYLIPWTVSQIVGLLIFFAAWKKPVWARYILGFLFLAAGVFNWITSIRTPEAYLMYSGTAIDLYRNFINGWFSDNIRLVVGAVASGQLLIGAGMLLGKRRLPLACLGIIVFLIAIAPLGVGSAFPFSITVSIAAFLVYRHWQTRWGATDNEVSMNLPGDELVVKPDFIATRGITIHASPDKIFPWIIQIGSKRAGWYSIDWIDNGGIQSAIKIIPEFQHIQRDQFIPFTPDQKNGMWVMDFEKDRFILWKDKEGNASWCWYLESHNDGTTRLLTRLRTQYSWRSPWIIYYLIYDIGDIVMMSKCLKGIKFRAEM